MTKRLQDKACIITGTGGSIGRAAALRFAAEGASVVGCDTNADAAQETVELALLKRLSPTDLHDATDVPQRRGTLELSGTTRDQLAQAFSGAPMRYPFIP
jgi:NAD(P)-dependent dehydrogenase (short-subunit alcohol dehydrogenase family)